MQQRPKIVILNGSSKKAEKSLNLRVAKVAQAFLEGKGSEVSLVHIGDEELPPFRGYDEPYPERARELLSLFEQADGYVVVTPEYHHAFPAGLKNLLEYIKGPGGIMADKPVVLAFCLNRPVWGHTSPICTPWAGSYLPYVACSRRTSYSSRR